MNPMKNLIFSPRFITFILFIGLFVLGCKDLKNLDPGKDLKIIMNYKPADSFVEAQVKDAKTGQLILDKINIEIIGIQSANVINFEGEAKTTYTKKGPSIYLGLRNVTPSDKNPINFKIIVSADGYLSSSRDVSLTGVSNAPVEILLVKTSSLPSGAAIQQSTLSSTAGTGTNQDKVIEVQNGQNTTLVEIDKGTIFKDSKGVILTGNLQTTVVTFSGDSKDAAKALPGGNFVSLDKGPNGAKDVKVTILPITFAAVELKDANGSKVANFNQPVDISFEINPNTINPKTKTKYKVGDKISVLSYNEISATWTYEKEGIIIQKGAEYFVTFSTNHLSWYGMVELWSSQSIFVVTDPNEEAYFATKTNFGIALDVAGQNSSNLNRNYSGSYPFEYELHFAPSTEGGSPKILWGKGILGCWSSGCMGTYFYNFTNLPTIAEKLVIKITIDGEVQVFEIKDFKNPGYTIQAKSKWGKLKTIYPSVSCENNCPLEIKPYNIGIEFILDENIGLNNTWSSLGNVSYDESDGKTKLTTFLPDNLNISVRATSYPEFIKQINTGLTDSFTVPILLTKDHPLCKCGK